MPTAPSDYNVQSYIDAWAKASNRPKEEFAGWESLKGEYEYYASLPEWAKSLDDGTRNAAGALIGVFEQYGLGSLAPKIVEYIKRGFDADTVQVLLQDTDEYKQRFAGNESRRKAGLPVLSPGEYLAVETQMKSNLRAFGLPVDFYDKPDDFAGLIGANISPDEVASRAQAAWKFTQGGNPEAREALRSYYGVEDDADIAAYFLDPEKGQALVEKRARAAEFGSLGLRAGLGGVSQGTAERLVDTGAIAENAKSMFDQYGQRWSEMQAAASRFGESFTADDVAERAGMFGDGAEKASRIAQKEANLFAGGRGGVAFGSSSSDV